jgi:hypothetical protein
MIGIKVCRNSTFPGECRSDDPNLNWGNDISDPLLTDEAVAKERGRVEIDSSYTNRVISGINTANRKYIPMGTIVGINEGGEVKNGMLKSAKISLVRERESFATATEMIFERNSDES